MRFRNVLVIINTTTIYRRKDESLHRIIEIKRHSSNATGRRTKVYFWISYLFDLQVNSKKNTLICIYSYLKYSVIIENKCSVKILFVYIKSEFIKKLQNFSS